MHHLTPNMVFEAGGPGRHRHDAGDHTRGCKFGSPAECGAGNLVMAPLERLQHVERLSLRAILDFVVEPATAHDYCLATNVDVVGGWRKRRVEGQSVPGEIREAAAQGCSNCVHVGNWACCHEGITTYEFILLWLML